MCGTVGGGFVWFIVRLIARSSMSWSDTTPASNVSGTHSYLAAVRRTDRIALWHLLGVFMTLQKAKSIARHLGLTLRQLRSGNYRVNFRDGNELRPTTQTISKTPILRLKWLVSERFQTIANRQNPGRSRSACDDYSGSNEQMFGADE